MRYWHTTQILNRKSSRLCLQQSIKCKSVDSCRWSLCSYLILWSCLMSVVSWVVCSCVGLPSYMLMVCVRRAMPPETLWVFVVQYEMKRHMCDKDMFYVGMKRTNACSYALTWVNVGFNMKVSVVAAACFLWVLDVEWSRVLLCGFAFLYIFMFLRTVLTTHASPCFFNILCS